MPLCLVVTRDVESRYRGFLGSIMLELAPGVYANPRMTQRTRERVWQVVSEWYSRLRNGSVVMAWRDTGAVGGMGVSTLGEPPKELIEVDGLLVVRRAT